MTSETRLQEQRPIRLHGSKFAAYKRCQCGMCRECHDNDKWDRIFKKFEMNVYWDERGVFQSTLSR